MIFLNAAAQRKRKELGQNDKKADYVAHNSDCMAGSKVMAI